MESEMATISKSFLKSNPRRNRSNHPEVVKLEYPALGRDDKQAGVIIVISAKDTDNKQFREMKHQKLALKQNEVNDLAVLTHSKADEIIRDAIALEYMTSIDDKKLLELLDRVHYRRYAETIPLRNLKFSEEVMTIFEEKRVEVINDIVKGKDGSLFNLMDGDTQHIDEVAVKLELFGFKVNKDIEPYSDGESGTK